MQEIALFSGKVNTAGTNFTRPPVVTVATNLNSASGVATLQLDKLLCGVDMWSLEHCQD